MKRIVALLLTFCLCFSLNSCNLSEILPLTEDTRHVYVRTRDIGYCDFLKGNVLVTVIFTDEDNSAWTDQEINTFKEGMDEATGKLTDEAKSYGIELNLTFNFIRSEAKSSVTKENCDAWAAEALKAAGFSDEEKANLYLKETYSVDQAPILFAVNRGGRSFACPQNMRDGLEYALLYDTESDYRHELLHLFGAKDFYFPAEVKTFAQENFPNSIMLTAAEDSTVDSFTAYLIGWNDTLTPEADSFLALTEEYTQAYLNEAKEEDNKTGYDVDYNDKTTYTGYFENGLYHGQGKFVWNESKTVLEGTFEYGYPTVGTMTWSDGTVYTGPFKNWKMHGYGKTVWPSGNVYVGYYKDGKRHGEGTVTFADGSIKSGTWEDGVFVD